MDEMTRRELLHAAALGAGLVATSEGLAQQRTADASGPAFTTQFQVKPLPFDAKKLRGLSERLVMSHWENNYGGAVKALNVVRERLGALLDSSDPAYLYNELKREHLMRTGSIVLHELYFANMGGDGRAPANIRSALAKSFGTFDAWETEFRKIGQGLGGGSGWVVLGYNDHLRLLENYWLGDHAHNPPHTRPIVVMDMYEHAYHMDFGAAAAKYIDAFFDNIDWGAVERRLA